MEGRGDGREDCTSDHQRGRGVSGFGVPSARLVSLVDTRKAGECSGWHPLRSVGDIAPVHSGVDRGTRTKSIRHHTGVSTEERSCIP